MRVGTTVLVLALICGSFAMDLCSFGPQEVMTVQTMLECWSIIPYSASVSNQTIDVLLKTIPLYVFLDSARHSPDPRLPVDISLDTELQALTQQDFTFDYEFHAAVDNIFTQLRDGHTRYLSPMNYGAFTYGFPLGLEIFVEDGVSKMMTTSPLFNDLVPFYKSLGIDLLSLSGMEVTSIEGTDPIEYMIAFARNRVGLILDPSARVNLALTDIFAQSFVNRSISNIIPSIVMSIDSQTLEIPLYARAKQNLNTQDFLGLYQPGPFTQEPQPQAVSLSPKLHHFFPEIPVKMDATLEPSLQGPGIQVYYVANPHKNQELSCVFVIATFEPGNGSQFDETEFKSIFTQGLQECRTKFVRDYLLDFSYNPGGDIELANFVISTLFPQFSAMTIFDMRKSPLQDLLFSKGSQDSSQVFYYPTYHYNVDTGAEYLDGSFYTNTRTFMRGGVESNYSQPFYWNLGISDDSEMKRNVIKPESTVGPNQLLILTKGICASACSITTSYLHLFDNVKTVAAGGISGQPQMFSAIPANVIEFADLQALVQQYNIQSDLVPGNFPTSGSVRFAFQEVYGFNLTVPLQYVFDAADYRLDFTRQSAVNQTQLWLDTMQFFE